ncbi:MAG: hypothetical protein IK118_02135 [Clostridia bacterium]|nr:hypothetical protein [Clostridia bacterium]MBR5427122.1 hypothetical protein [Clostridia bacterium]
MRRTEKILSAVLCVLLLFVNTAILTPESDAAAKKTWAGAWSVSPVPTGYNIGGTRFQDFMLNSSCRTVIKTTLGGEKIRFKFSNRYGSSNLEIKKVRVARTSPLSDTAIIEGTSLPVTFGDMSGAIIPPGKTVYTDPVTMHVESFEKLTITVYYASFTPMSTGGLINAKSYIDPGDRTEAVSFYAQSPLTITSGAIVYNTTPFLCGAETYGKGNSCVVMFGDSTLANDSSYYLAEKFYISGMKNVGVLQQAIIGNELLHDRHGVTNISHLFGDSGLSRFTEDVLDQAGVKAIYVKIGLNDILHPRSKSLEGSSDIPSVDDIATGYRQLVSMAHEKGIKIYFFGRQEWKGYSRSFYGSADSDLVWTQEAEDVLVALNKWLRYSSPADGYIPVDALKDPDDPLQLRPEYTLDGAHLTPLGAQILIDLIPDHMLSTGKSLKSIRQYYAEGGADILNYTEEKLYTKLPPTTEATLAPTIDVSALMASTKAPTAAAPATAAPSQNQPATAPYVTALPPTAAIPSTTLLSITDAAGDEITEIFLVPIEDVPSTTAPVEIVEISDASPSAAALRQAPEERISGAALAGTIVISVITLGLATFLVIYLMNRKQQQD